MTKEVGTLAEIGAKVGDVVRVEQSFSNTMLPVGYEVQVNEHGRLRSKCGMFDGHNGLMGTHCTFRVLNPQPTQTGPVRTVTRKEIVPGVYGRIAVFKNDYKHTVLLRFADAGGDCDLLEQGHYLNAEQLTAAITTLTAIRDALAEQETHA